MTEKAAEPWLNITPHVAIRTAAATVLISTGMFYLVSGRRDADFGKMTKGAVLCLLSLAAFAF